MDECNLLKSRLGGVLLHPTSLPSRYGIGDIGPNLLRFLKFLNENSQSLWQILPLGPTGFGDSPYQTLSAFAGNPNLISIDGLHELNLLDDGDLPKKLEFSKDKVEYGKAIPIKSRLLRKAYHNYEANNQGLKKLFTKFKEENAFWLDDFAVFMGLKISFDQTAWNDWPEEYRNRKSPSVTSWEENNTTYVEYHKFVQFTFYYQWSQVKKYSDELKISIIGDLPIFVAYDSSDVWANPELFSLNEDGSPVYIAGVPPDRYSSTGQRWGNPIYNWDKIISEDFKWWIQRIKQTLKQVDIIRLDHFIGYENYWRIPAYETTAINGEWIKAPGELLFKKLKQTLGSLPFIAEDLGVLTPEVENLRDRLGFPGMRILQFAFSDHWDPSNPNLPHNFKNHCIVYTGTHDNKTTLGWFKSVPKKTQSFILDYANSIEDEIVKNMIRLAISSPANLVIIPMQDILRVGKQGRMNFPGKSFGNWKWRFRWEQVNSDMGNELAHLTQLYGRNQK
ncbi:MAG: 4-alpha-glucanotransferase [Candidatus Kariarchaeaceae archaeon]